MDIFVIWIRASCESRPLAVCSGQSDVVPVHFALLNPMTMHKVDGFTGLAAGLRRRTETRRTAQKRKSLRKGLGHLKYGFSMKDMRTGNCLLHGLHTMWKPHQRPHTML